MTPVFLNVGSNTARTAHIRAGLDALQQQFGALQVSSVYESEALGFSGAHFYNLAVSASTTLSLAQLATWLRRLEYASGREPGAARFSARTLDIDILTFADLVGSFAGTELPRPEILFNAHVLGPLAELAPAAVHPVAGLSYARLWQAFEHRDKVWRVDFEWQGRQISSAPG